MIMNDQSQRQRPGVKESQSHEGSVLAEQTLLAFAADPPSSDCSQLLPSCVSEARGGETGFAMNHKTQLRFRLGVAPDHTKLATHFESSQPSPVTIEKMGSKTIGLSHTPVRDFKAVSPDRLELAVKLARRYVRDRKAQGFLDAGESMADTNQLSRKDGGREPHPLNDEAFFESTPKDLELRTNDGSDGRQSVHPQVIAQEITRLKAEDMELRTNDRSDGRQSVHPPQVIAQEITRLKAELQRQLVRLRKSADSRDRKKTPDAQVRKLYWDENEDEDKAREQQRRGEQLARNSRMIYDLSQQVKGLDKHFKEQKPPSSRAQFVVVQKLAAAQRAALRTLQGYSHHGRLPYPIPPELTSLVQQLGLLSSQLGGGANSDLMASLHQLMGHFENQQELVLLGQEKAAGLPLDSQGAKTGDVKAVSVKKNKHVQRKPRMTGGVLYSSPHRRYLQPRPHYTHFTNQTFASALRQQSPRMTPRMCTPESPYTRGQHSTTPKERCDFSPLYPSRTHLPINSVTRRKKKTPHSHPNRKAVKPSPCSPKPPPCSPKKKKKKMKKQDLLKGKRKVEVSFHDKEHVLSPSKLHSPSPPPNSEAVAMPPSDLNSAITMQARQLQNLREEISRKLAALDVGVGKPKVVPSSPPPPQTVTKSPPPMAQSSKQSSDPAISNMLRRLEELEAEEEAIRHRWNSIVYEDPLTTKPAITYARNEGHVTPKSSSQQISNFSELSSESLSSIEQYRKQYSHYLDSTGHSTQGGFNPWKMAESVADGLLGEALEGVASEVGQICDGCVEELYSNEFIRPP